MSKKKLTKKQIKEKILKQVKRIPLGAHIAIFGSNPATKLWGFIETHNKYSNVPTHSAIYVGAGKHLVLEAGKWVEFNSLDGYLKKKNVRVVAQWYEDIKQSDEQKLKDRIYWFEGKKFFYDLFGYAGFILRFIPILRKIAKPSRRLFFCSELVATIYEGDINSKHSDIKKWGIIRPISAKMTPTQAAPVDIYNFMKKARGCKSITVKKKGERI